MRTKLMIATAAAALLMAGAASAQLNGATGSNFSQNNVDTAVNPPLPVDANAPTATAPAPSADVSVAPAAGAPAETVPAASVGGTDVVSNGPVADTPENRAKYGKPMSNAGRMTKPAGN